MWDALKNFYTQFSYDPVIENAGTLGHFSKYLLAGMGGSHLSADLLRAWDPGLDIMIHSDYGLPSLSDDELRQRLVILSSYSGNTEEVLEAFRIALQKKLPMICISVGGKLLEMAKSNSISYIQFPDTGIQPRMSVGLAARALMKIIGDERGFRELGDLSQLLKTIDFEASAEGIAEKMKGKTPIFYASRRNRSLAKYWKIVLNESAKIPAFWNTLPELNHNEMTGFDRVPATEMLSNNFFILMLRDINDDPRILKRMEMLQMILGRRRIPIEIMDLKNELQMYKIFSSVLFASYTAYDLAKLYGVDPEHVPMVEEFKQLIQ